MSRSPICTIIAGPNGAGKTTFALNYLPKVAGTSKFINADLIAAGLSPLDPAHAEREAARIFISEIEQSMLERDDFAFETTLSGRAHLGRIRRMRSDGWIIRLIYLYLPDVESSIERVAHRVSEGGHDIPLEALLRRYPKSLRNLIYFFEDECDYVICFSNASGTPTTIFKTRASERYVVDAEIFGQIQDLINQ